MKILVKSYPPEGCTSRENAINQSQRIQNFFRHSVDYKSAILEQFSVLCKVSFDTIPSQYARIVREALCELELPYVLQSVGEGSRRTNLLFEASGSKEVPYIVDPNTGTLIGDYKKILSYLFQTYAMASS
ncbi:hypothetical protein RHMOL_Rhmol12G0004100 [Rhododendron molle]|uniref:Uncharacterized protein n=1 Tax=Rhododendron molle TaxID=49168 RepID=A0ACC0LDR7_RHOML|nr:hypothetical protein RHMOL_Rhmol12G0004100 [Rhododendron molle]